MQLSGNSANAALAAGTRASAVLKRRLKVFQEHGLTGYQDLADARIGVSSIPHHAPLQKGSYGIFMHETRLLIGKVITLYAGSGGKAVTHCWQREVSSVGQISYVVVQAYESSHLRKFRAVHHDLAALQTYRYLHVPSDYFLVRLADGHCTLALDGRTVELSAAAHGIFAMLLKSIRALTEATKQLANARRNSRNIEE